jgi:hypothetical protein
MHVAIRTKPRFERQSDTIYYSAVRGTFVRIARRRELPYLILRTKNQTKPAVNNMVAATGTARFVQAKRLS